eukprot:jgi/Chrzof1/3150/Cz12g13200.t1
MDKTRQLRAQRVDALIVHMLNTAFIQSDLHSARIQKFPDVYKDTDLSQSVTLSSPSPTEAPQLKHRPQHRAEDTESLERLRQQISINTSP